MDNIFHLFLRHAKATPHKNALIFQEQQVSYQTLLERVLKLSLFFKQQGLQSGQRIALFAPNGIEYAVVLLAAAKLGAAVVPLPITLKGSALNAALKKTPVRLVISWPTISDVLIENAVISSKEVITLGNPVTDEISWQAIFEREELDDLISNVDPNSDYILTMTSGSTGQPKPIVLSQSCKIARAMNSTVSYYGLTCKDVILVSTPLYHSLAQRGVLMPLLLGATSVIMPKFNLLHWLVAIEKHKVSFLFAVSSQLESLLREQQIDQDLSSLKVIVSSSAVLDKVSKSKLTKLLNCQFHECYGASEVGVVTDFCVNDYPENQESVGKPLPHIRVKITDSNKNALPIGQVGEIACLTATQFSGYLKMPTETESAFDSEGYFYTGDLGYLDDNNFLYYVGRKKEVISSGGINVYPQDIESVIKSHEQIDECIAFAVQDKQFGEAIKVVYTAKFGTIDDIELRKRCFQELTDYQQPRYFQQVTELPKTGLGKVLRNDVKLRFS